MVSKKRNALVRTKHTGTETKTIALSELREHPLYAELAPPSEREIAEAVDSRERQVPSQPPEVLGDGTVLTGLLHVLAAKSRNEEGMSCIVRYDLADADEKEIEKTVIGGIIANSKSPLRKLLCQRRLLLADRPSCTANDIYRKIRTYGIEICKYKADHAARYAKILAYGIPDLHKAVGKEAGQDGKIGMTLAARIAGLSKAAMQEEIMRRVNRGEGPQAAFNAVTRSYGQEKSAYALFSKVRSAGAKMQVKIDELMPRLPELGGVLPEDVERLQHHINCLQTIHNHVAQKNAECDARVERALENIAARSSARLATQPEVVADDDVDQHAEAA